MAALSRNGSGSCGVAGSGRGVRELASCTRLFCAMASLLGALNSAATAVVHLVPATEATNIDRFQRVFSEALLKRGVAPSIVESTRYLIVRDETKSIQDATRAAVDSATKILVAPTFNILAAILPLRPRPPIVFQVNVPNLVARLPQLSDPARANATGINAWGSIEGKQIELLLEVSPTIDTVCAIGMRTDLTEPSLATLQERAHVKRLALLTLASDTESDFLNLMETKLAPACGAFIVGVNPPLMNRPEWYIRQLQARSIPVLFPRLSLLRHGAIFALEADTLPMRELSFDMAANMLKGTASVDMPIVSPARYRFGIGVGAARGSRQSLPRRIIVRATDISH